MEFRTAYDLTLSMYAGRLLVKALVAYHETVLGTCGVSGRLPDVFEVPGVLRIENVAIIESHAYEVVPNPVREFHSVSMFTDGMGIRYRGAFDPRRDALSEEDSLRVRFVVWQRAVKSVNT